MTTKQLRALGFDQSAPIPFQKGASVGCSPEDAMINKTQPLIWSVLIGGAIIYWGMSRHISGANMLGKRLMQVRGEIR